MPESGEARYELYMRITVLYFAVLKERLGRSEEPLSVPDGNRVKDAIDLLCTKYWDVAQLRGKFRIAINEEFIDDESIYLKDGDTMALVPPVAGGSDRYVKIMDSQLSLDRVVHELRDEQRMAACVARDHLRLERRIDGERRADTAHQLGTCALVERPHVDVLDATARPTHDRLRTFAIEGRQRGDEQRRYLLARREQLGE